MSVEKGQEDKVHIMCYYCPAEADTLAQYLEGIWSMVE